VTSRAERKEGIGEAEKGKLEGGRIKTKSKGRRVEKSKSERQKAVHREYSGRLRAECGSSEWEDKSDSGQVY
jgi:hypothetical protein